MKRTLLMLGLGAAIGVATHLGYYRLHIAAGDPLDQRLSWMKTELKLTDAQYASIKALHQKSGPQLQALSTQVAQLRAEFIAFETGRRDHDKVDFVEFARFVEYRRRVNRECQDSTRRLILASAQVMSPAQRTRFLDLVAAADPSARAWLN